MMCIQDDVIQRFEVRFIKSQNEARRLAEELAKTRKQLEVSQVRISDLLDVQAKHRRAAAARAEEFTMLHASLTATIADLKVPRPVRALPPACSDPCNPPGEVLSGYYA